MRVFKIGALILLALLVGNILLLDYTIFVSKTKPQESEFNVVSVATPSPRPSKQEEVKQGTKIIDSCYPRSCIDLIREATQGLSPKQVTTQKPQRTSLAGEFYVTFGSGQTTSDEWVDIPGLVAYIDSTKYGKIKKVTFEATMYIQNAHGRVYAQLYNEIDKHPVWFSEISMEGDKPQLLISNPITLDPGNKLYKVQMKTTLKEVSFIEQARVHIITE